VSELLSDDWKIEKVALLSTGSEILQGQYADSNARFLAEEFTLAGVNVVAIMAAPDDPTAIMAALDFCSSRSDLIVCTGGLGPTVDDVNRFVFEKAFDAPLERDETAIEGMARRFVSRGYGPMPEANEVQALLPKGCIPFYNRWGTAPGFLLLPTGRGLGKRCGLLAMPGPPSEMIPMFQQLAMPAIGPYLLAGRVGLIRTIHTYGYPESEIGALVKELFNPASDAEFTILAKTHGVDLRIKALAQSKDAAEDIVARYETKVRQLLRSEMIYGVDDETLASNVGILLKLVGAWVTTAESCTGGMVSEFLTEVAGSSSYIGECHVTYSNEAKVKVLGVKQETLDMYGAVSEQTAIEMAGGARRISDADYAISVTGIAGPDGGSAGKPVGLTYISVAGPKRTVTTRNTYTGNRSQNRLSATLTALNMVRLELLSAAE